MKQNQHATINHQVPSPYRDNYHINPAQSKIVYKSPQNIYSPNQNINNPNANFSPHQNINQPTALNQIQNYSSPPHYLHPVNTPQNIQYVQSNQPRHNLMSPVGNQINYNQNGYTPQSYYISNPQNNQSTMVFPFQSNQLPNQVNYPQVLNQNQNSMPHQTIISQPMNPGKPVNQIQQNRSQVQNVIMKSAPTGHEFKGQNANFQKAIGSSLHLQQNLLNSAGGVTISFKKQNSQMTNLASTNQLNQTHSINQTYQLNQSNQPYQLNQTNPLIQTQLSNQSKQYNSIPANSVVGINLDEYPQNNKTSIHLTETISYPPPNVPHIAQPLQVILPPPPKQIYKNQTKLHRTDSLQVQSPAPIKESTTAVKPQIPQSEQFQEQNNGQNASNPIWEQRFIMIYQKFQWFYERYDFISRQFLNLSQQFENVNSQDQWLELKEKHDLLLEKIQQIQEQLANTIHQNQQLAEQYELQNRNSKESDEGQRVWEHRYHQLLEQYKNLSQNYADLQSQGNNLNNSQSQHSQGKGGMNIQEQAQIQNKFQQLQHQYNVLCQQYEKIRIQYQKTYEQNIQYNKQNNDLMISHQQSRNMASQLQGYVEQLQQQNDQLRKQQRKSSPAQDPNSIPREEVQKMQYHYDQQIQRYQEQLQKYQMAIDQYEQQSQLNRQQLQKISQIAMQRQNKIKELESSQANVNSKSNHSNNQFSGGEDAPPELQRTYINRLQHEIKQLKQRQKQLLHKLQIKDLERRSLDDKIHYLERQFEVKKEEFERMGKNFDQKLLRIEHNTSNNSIQGVQGSRHAADEDVVRPTSNSQYQSQIHELQSQLIQLQSNFNAKMSRYKQLERSIETYQSQIRKQSNQQTMTSIQFQKRISQIEIDLGKKLAERELKITVLNSEIQRLQQSIQTVSRHKDQTKQTLKYQFQQNQQHLMQKYGQKISQLQQKIKQKSQQINYNKQLVQKFQKQLKVKNEELIELRTFVNQIKKSASSSSQSSSRNQLLALRQEVKTKQETLQRRNEQISKLKRQKEYKIKHVTELQHQLEDLNTQTSKRRAETSALKRQLSDFQALQFQFQTIKSSFNKKVVQITQLRQQLFEIQKVKLQNQSQKRDISRFSEQNKQKHHQIQNLKQKIYQLQKKCLSVKNNSSIPSNNQNLSQSQYKSFSYQKDQSQVLELRQLIKRKDSEISRINQSLQENQYLLESKTRDQQLLKSQISALSRTKQSEVTSLNHNISSLETRLKQSESKRSKLIEETNQLRTKFEDQLKSQSQRHKSYYDKVIQRHEQDYKSLKEKIRAAEQINNKLQISLQRSKSSQKNLEIQIRELNKKLAAHHSQVLQKQELFSTFRKKQSQTQQSTKVLYEKISSIELQLKTKQQQLKLSEEKNTILEQKIKKNKKEHQNFRNKLMVSQQYQNNNSVVEYLSKRIAEYESKMINQSEHDFGFKIKNSQANHVFENQVVYHLKMENEMLRKQLEGKGIQFDRKVLNQIQEENLKRSKNLLKNSTFSSKLGNISSQLLSKENIEDVNFYKQKNKQLEQRVQKHLKVNKQLKDKIQQLIKGSSQSKQIQHYKGQITQFEHKIHQLEKKSETLAEENKSISKGMSKRQSRAQEHYEQRIKQLQVKLNQAIKNLQQVNQQKNELEISRSELQMQKTILNDQIKRLNEKITNFTNSKHERHEEQQKQLRQKCEQYESEIAKLCSRSKILQSEIQRLNQVTASSKLSLNQLNNFKLKVTELTQQLAKSDNNLHEQQIKSNALASEVVLWQQKSKFFENQIQRLKQINELYAKKQQPNLTESSVLKQSTSSNQVQLSSLQNQITALNSTNFQNQSKIQGLSQQIIIYMKLIQSFEFYFELIRSGVLQEESLVEEVIMGGQNVGQCIDGLRVNVERNLYCIQQLYKKVKRM